jgi:hypothetical protein
MVNAALVISYLFLVLVVVIVVVLFCLGCGCHVPLGKCVRCFCDNTTQCCRDCSNSRKKKKGEDKFKSVLDEPKRGEDAKRRAAARKKEKEDATSIAGCCSWIPWIVTCGMCCGAFEEDKGEEKGGQKVAVGVAVAQPVEVVDAADEVVGTEAVVAVSIPLLSMQ